MFGKHIFILFICDNDFFIVKCCEGAMKPGIGIFSPFCPPLNLSLTQSHRPISQNFFLKKPHLLLTAIRGGLGGGVKGDDPPIFKGGRLKLNS